MTITRETLGLVESVVGASVRLEPAPPPAKSLAAKLARVMLTTGHVAKSGRNQTQGYAYATAEDIAAEVRGALAAQSVAVIPRLTSTEYNDHPMTMRDGKQAVWTLCTAQLVYSLVDGDTGEIMDCAWQGQGLDNGDKALPKALTMALKTWLVQTFLIPRGDDAEADERVDKSERSAPRAPRTYGKPVAPAAVPTDGDPLREFFALARSYGWDTMSAEEMRVWIGKAIGRPVQSRSEVTPAEWATAITALKAQNEPPPDERGEV